MEQCGCCTNLLCHEECADECRCLSCGTAICPRCDRHGHDLCDECQLENDELDEYSDENSDEYSDDEDYDSEGGDDLYAEEDD